VATTAGLQGIDFVKWIALDTSAFVRKRRSVVELVTMRIRPGWGSVFFATVLAWGCSVDSHRDESGDAVDGADSSCIPNGDVTTRSDPGDLSAQGLGGWISVIENNDSCDQWNLVTRWRGGIRAAFFVAPSMIRALPHQLAFMDFVEQVGTCSFFRSRVVRQSDSSLCINDYDKAYECFRECGPDQQAVNKTGAVEFACVCEDLPAHGDAGQISIDGLKIPVVMNPDCLDLYLASQSVEVDDLFDAGQVITARATGGVVPAFEVASSGVAPLEMTSSVVELDVGQPATVRWNSADPGSRIQVLLLLGTHDPNPIAGAVLCDAPDEDGQLVIDAALVDEFREQSCGLVLTQKCSRITRYRRTVVAPYLQDIELFVGSARNLQVLYR